MLEASEKQFAEASVEERRTAEAFASSFMATQMEQDLIPADEARRITGEHRESGTKEWRRAVYAAMMALRSIKA